VERPSVKALRRLKGIVFMTAFAPAVSAVWSDPSARDVFGINER
jgi:hypothetical protein